MCGDPPNIIIGTSLGFSFADFVTNTGNRCKEQDNGDTIDKHSKYKGQEHKCDKDRDDLVFNQFRDLHA